MARQLFGTDGIRGVAGEFPLDRRTVYATGVALGRLAARLSSPPIVLLGMDTRESGPWIASHLAGGLRRGGARTEFAGLITTPGVAFLTRNGPFVAGVMISASHNLYRDNGIKVFGHSGYKLPDAEEQGIEAGILELARSGLDPEPLELPENLGLGASYEEFLSSTVCHSLEGVRVVVDCANGAASQMAPRLFTRCGAGVEAIARSPDGRNINLECGSLYPETVRREVLSRGADVGVALDGDADRSILVSRSGKIIDGDALLLVIARALLERRELPGPQGVPTVVATVMSNLGLEKALADMGIRMLRTNVGDKYVLEEMLRRGAMLGGEQSGHIILRKYATTGDGLLTTLRMLEIMRETGQNLDQLTQDLVVYPQRLVNVPVRARKPLEDVSAVTAEIQAARETFGGSGRILVRYSGTELVARVMVEGREAALVDGFADRIAAAIRTEIGAEG